MTQIGFVHLCSMIYLASVICFSISLNENRAPRMILKETLRRLLKFLGTTFAIALAVYLMSR